MDDNSINKKKIIVIDDDPVMRLSCLKILEKEGYAVQTFEDGEQGLAGVMQNRPDLLVVDLKMPKIGGLEVINSVHEVDPDICIVVITGYATIGTAVEAMKSGAYDFLPKPFTPDELRLIVNRGIERSELTRQSKQLKLEKEALEKKFVTFVSHQLQSPLVAVQQYLDVLNHLGNVPDKEKLQQEWIDRSLSRIKELLTLIREWLTYSKIEKNTLVCELKSVSVIHVLEEIIATYEPRAKENNITIKFNCPNGISPAKAERECLSMLFSNLIVNAIKYNDKDVGRINIDVTEDNLYVIVSVSDNGVGISKDKLDLIFEEFYRVKNEKLKDVSGTGLGLPICKKIIHELNGLIEVSSEENIGTRFIVKLLKFVE